MRQISRTGRRWGILALGWVLPALLSCNTQRPGEGPDEAPDAAMQVDQSRPCFGLQCKIPQCPAGQTTTISGVVNVPAGNLPLANAVVYIPQNPLAPISTGASCTRCDTAISGNPLVRVNTDSHGRFTLANVPAGADIPLVVQLGKWRRQTRLQVSPCTDNPVVETMTRLPGKQADGDLPKIALTTGGADALECLLRKIGIEESEFTPIAGSGRVNLYNGVDGTLRYDPALNGGAAFSPADPFWESLDDMKKYDMVVLSCEGIENSTNKSAKARQAMLNYLDFGGRVFASHWHNYWVERGPAPLPTVAKFNHRTDPSDPATADIDTSFERGAAFADWLVNVGASTQPGKLILHVARNSVESVNASLAQRWIHIPSQNSIQYLSFNTPVGADEKMACGRMVLSDIHVSSGDSSQTTLLFPKGCKSNEISPQEKALIYMLFDLSNCLGPIIG